MTGLLPHVPRILSAFLTAEDSSPNTGHPDGTTRAANVNAFPPNDIDFLYEPPAGKIGIIEAITLHVQDDGEMNVNEYAARGSTLGNGFSVSHVRRTKPDPDTPGDPDSFRDVVIVDLFGGLVLNSNGRMRLFFEDVEQSLFGTDAAPQTNYIRSVMFLPSPIVLLPPRVSEQERNTAGAVVTGPFEVFEQLRWDLHDNFLDVGIQFMRVKGSLADAHPDLD